jgi:hypothetical protein
MNGYTANTFRFTFDYIESEYVKLQAAGYTFFGCADYQLNRLKLPTHVIVNRVDIDLSIKKSERILDIFNRLGIKATFFVRLHAPEYNPFSFENYRILKKIIEGGHEIGLHCEVIDQSVIWGESPDECLRRDIAILNRMLNTQIVGAASHGGTTGLNNLDFWLDKSASEFGLAYEAYEKSASFNLFARSLYISDSEWTQWKTYKDGILANGDRRSPSEHLKAMPPLIYLLIHPDTWFEKHIYENE